MTVAPVLLKAEPSPNERGSAVLFVTARVVASVETPVSTKVEKFTFLKLSVLLMTKTAASSPTTFWTPGVQEAWPCFVAVAPSAAAKPTARESMVAGRKLRDIGPIDWTPRGMVAPLTGVQVPVVQELNFIWFSAFPEPVPS